MKKRCLLAYIYGVQNAGDFAICYGALDCLTELYDEVVAVSRYSANSREFNQTAAILSKRYGKSVILIPGPFSLDRSSKVSTICSYTQGAGSLLRSAIFGWKTDVLKTCEKIYINGGNLLRSESLTDSIRLEAILFFPRLASKLEIPCIFLPQSTAGSLDNHQGKKLIRALCQAEKSFFRESVTFEKMKEMGVHGLPSLDMAYYIQDEADTEVRHLQKSSSTEFVCCTVRKNDIGDIGEISSESQQIIREEFQKFVHLLRERGLKCVFVVQTKKDISFTKEIVNLCEGSELVEEYDPLSLRDLYRRSRCLIGMRLHSIILASSVGTPVVGYFREEWGVKNPGTLLDIGMPFAFVGDGVSLGSLMANALNHREDMVASINSRKNIKNFI